MPNPSERCSSRASCVYDWTPTCSDTEPIYDCVGGVWTARELVPASCPSELPALGAACPTNIACVNAIRALDCTYPQAKQWCPIVNAHCVIGSRWVYTYQGCDAGRDARE